VFIDNFVGFESFVRSYIYIILIMGIGGVITFFIHLIFGISPIFQVKYSLTGTTYFLGLTSTNDYLNFAGIRIVRYSGFFDEPGAFALYSLFAIILNKIYFDNRKIELSLITVTAFTLSLAFFIVIVAYFFLFYFKPSQLKYIIVAVILVITLYYYLADYKGDNESVKSLRELTFERLKLNEKGTFKGNNRYDATLHDKMLFMENPVLGVQVEHKVRGNNIFSILAKYGALGAMFYYAFLLYFFVRILKLHGKQQILFLKLFLIIIANFFHRPEFSAAFTLLIIYSMIKYLDLSQEKPAANQILKY
jgi:hypothetical protein